MRTEPKHRRRHTAVERGELVAGYHRSGLTQGEFAVRNGLSLSCLRNWLRRSRAADEDPAQPTLLRLPVELTAGGRAGPAYRIMFPCGHSLEVAAGFRVDELRELCRLVRGL